MSKLNGQVIRETVIRQPVAASDMCLLQRSDRFWNPTSLLFDGYQRTFPQDSSCRGEKATTQSNL